VIVDFACDRCRQAIVDSYTWISEENKYGPEYAACTRSVYLLHHDCFEELDRARLIVTVDEYHGAQLMDGHSITEEIELKTTVPEANNAVGEDVRCGTG